ncbi:MAG: SDR family oxidoreductase [Caldilineaceae bacterium]
MTQQNGSMQGKICLVTGATAGIGEVTARELARLGAHVLVVGRSRAKAAATVNQIKQQTGNPNVEFMLADLSSQQAIRQLADQFKQQHNRLDVLLNNAGALFMQRQETVDGLEMTFALNHLSYFLLTNLLLDTLKASAPARIINVASDAHQGSVIHFDDLQGRQKYRGFSAYSQSKLANILFTYELARRLVGTQVTANTLHPGFVASNFATNNGWFYDKIFRFFAKYIAISPEQGARTSVYLASSPEVANVSGKYFVKQKVATSSRASYDEAAAQRLWQVSEALTGLATSGA